MLVYVFDWAQHSKVFEFWRFEFRTTLLSNPSSLAITCERVGYWAVRVCRVRRRRRAQLCHGLGAQREGRTAGARPDVTAGSGQCEVVIGHR